MHLKHVERLLLFIISLSSVKFIFGVPFYLNSLLCGVGGFFLKKKFTIFFPVIFVGLINVLSCLYYDAQIVSVARLFQLFLLISAAEGISRLSYKIFLDYSCKIITAVIFFDFCFFCITVINNDVTSIRGAWGVTLPRLVGIMGNANYSAILYLCLMLLFLFSEEKRKIQAGYFIGIISFFTLSRATVLAGCIVLVAYYIKKIFGNKLYKFYVYICFGVVLLFPIVLLSTNNIISESGKVVLTKWSSLRYPYWVAYADVGLKHPFGVGYFNAENFVSKKCKEHREDIVALVHKAEPGQHKSVGSIQQHSLQLQVISEFGWIGYFILTFPLLKLIHALMMDDDVHILVLLALFIGYTFINGLSDWTIWVITGSLSAYINVKKSDAGNFPI